MSRLQIRGYGLRKQSGIFEVLDVLLPRIAQSEDASVSMDDIVQALGGEKDAHYVQSALNMHFAGTFSFRRRKITLKSEWGTLHDLQESARLLREEQVNPRRKEHWR